MKKQSLCAVWAALCLLLSACGQTSAPQPITPAEPQPAGQEQPQQPADPAPAEPQPALRELECLRGKGQLLALWDAGEGRVAVQWWEIDPQQPEGRGDVCLGVVDLETDTLLRELTVRQPEEQLLGVRKSGELLTLADDVLRIYDPETGAIAEQTVARGFYGFDREGDCLYTSRGGRLLRCTPEGAEETVLDFTPGGAVPLLDAEKGWALVSWGTENDDQPAGFGLYDIALKEFTFTGEDDCAALITAGDWLLRQEEITGEDDEVRTVATAYELESGRVTSRLELPRETWYMGEPGVARAIGVRALFDGPEGAFTGSELTAADFAAGAWGAFAVDLKGYSVDHVVYIPEGDLFVAGASGGADGGDLRLLALCPESVDLTERFPAATIDKVPSASAPLGEELLAARQMADALESDFGVRVLLGNECRPAFRLEQYELISTEDPDAFPAPDVMGERAEEALRSLREALEAYPDSFFEAFRNFRGEGGLRFFLAGDFRNPTGSFLPGGVQYVSGAWYNVAVTVDMMQGETGTVHHELWHAMEMRITAEYPDAFYPEDWQAFNPGGFAYGEDLDAYWDGAAPDPDGWVLQTTADPYFVRAYSAVNAWEDRATLAELAMEEDYGWGMTGYDVVRSYPHLLAKLQEMERWALPVFGAPVWGGAENAA